ncbi:MAG: hypothetical protein KAR31_08715, partial [Candidatus Omnitrophica bacterium]|nr:hypothetical protein [Candidatus Omnitrophota bacterium]
CDVLLGCQVGVPLVCTDNNVCTGIETCDAILGCQPGVALVCTDAHPCTIDGCDAIAGCQFPAMVCPALMNCVAGVCI